MTDTTKRVDVERWDWSWKGHDHGQMTSQPTGAYVRHSDYAVMEAKLAEREAEIESLRSSVAALESVQDDALERATDRIMDGTIENAVMNITELRKRAEKVARAKDEACGLLLDIKNIVRSGTNLWSYSATLGKIDAFLAANGERDA